MQANHDRFQAIAVGKRTYSKDLVLKKSSAEIKEVVKILAVDVDYQLNFDQPISAIC